MYTTRDIPVLGLRLDNPVIVGSGLLTDQARNIRKLIETGAGAVVTKTIHPAPPHGLDERIHRLPVGMLNSTTYSKRGVQEWLGNLREFADDNLPVIASVYADSPTELAELAAAVAGAGSAALELGISCLNDNGGLDDTAERVADYTAAARRATTRPISVKLSIGEGLRARAAAAIEAGADALSISDTIPGAAVTASGALELGGVFGYSGPGIKPLVLAALWDLRRSGITIPVLGIGGVTTADDVRDYLAVGACAVQVYTALHTDMYRTLSDVVAGTRKMTEQSDDATEVVA
ncbi:hypothetical protein [Pseudonocardia sp. ICBG162]|uniref:hypothetical protein n=1 Tax=Pseudonocardia sp. ICBG162 TaxID=2846761 RepID=UPI001CF71470|nr:hypothetical protein [Pseudonocardia sp. ICBG162]